MSFYDNCANDKRLSIIAGPCVYESNEHCLMMAESLRDIAGKFNMNFMFKTSFDKANRTSAQSFRGKGFDEPYYTFQTLAVRGIECITDIHEPWHADAVMTANIQIPAFLCRQTDLLAAAAQSGKPVNVKKGQFLSYKDMFQVVVKLQELGAKKIMVTERGTTFGYNNLVVDMRGIDWLRQHLPHFPIIMDATHAAQAPGGNGINSGGNREDAKVLARAAAAVGVAGMFMEVHDDPDNAPSDGPNMIKLQDFENVLDELLEIDYTCKKWRAK